MLPLLRPNEFVQIQLNQDLGYPLLRPGQVVWFRSPEGGDQILHRIVWQQSPSRFLVKGDYSRAIETVEAKQILGTLCGVASHSFKQNALDTMISYLSYAEIRFPNFSRCFRVGVRVLSHIRRKQLL